MGNQVIFDALQEKGLDRSVGTIGTAPTWTIKLFKNDITPLLGTTVIGDFTEATFDGYTSHTLSSWGGVSLTYPYALSEHALILWLCTGPGGGSQTVYGYWIEDEDGDLALAEKFSTPFDMSDVPDYIYFRPIMRYESYYHAAYPTDPLVPTRVQEFGRYRFLRAILGQAFPTGFDVHLFKNDLAVTDQLVIADLVECDFGGYSTKPGNTWSAAIFNPVSGMWEANAGNKFWFPTAGGPTQDAYGYYLTELGSGDLMAVKTFLTPQAANDGDFVAALPLLSGYTEFQT